MPMGKRASSVLRVLRKSIALRSATPARAEEVPEAQRQQMREQLSMASADQAAKAFIAELRKKRKIDIVESQL